MQNFVYILGTKNLKGWRTYVGGTTDLDARLNAHNQGRGAKSTRGRAWVLLYAEKHKTRSEAMKREWEIKRNKKFRKAIRP